MKIVIASDSFKGCLTSAEVARAACDGIREAKPDADCVMLPVSDGGDGMLDAFISAMNGLKVKVNSHDALMRHVSAEYGIARDTAIIEVAQACGLAMIEKEQRNPVVATSYGVGEILADAVQKGMKKIIIGLGGTATSDCGIGMLKALLKKLGRKEEIIDDVIKRCFHGVEILLASDVANPLCGQDGAAYVYAPQKGATAEMLPMLDNRAMEFAEVSARHFEFDCSHRPGAGAAGGLGYVFMQYLGAEFMSGAELLLNFIDFDTVIENADMVITGEGSCDRQTLMGKLPYHVMKHAEGKGVKTIMLAGRVGDEELLRQAGFTAIYNINPEGMTMEQAKKPEQAVDNIKVTVKDVISRL